MEEISRLFDILTRYEEKWPEQKVALAAKRDGAWKTFSPKEYKEITDNISYGLMNLGIQPGDRVGLISSSTPL